MKATPICTTPRGCLSVVTEPYHPRYYVINGRSMPDDMDADYAPNYPAQPYNGNPHMHPLDQVLIRTIGQGRWEHPFHEHANHVRILARDGNLILSQTDQTKLAGLMMFNTDTWPGQAFDGIFYWSGKGLAWDIYAHTPKLSDGTCPSGTPIPGPAPAPSPAHARGRRRRACEPEVHPGRERSAGYFTHAYREREHRYVHPAGHLHRCTRHTDDVRTSNGCEPGPALYAGFERVLHHRERRLTKPAYSGTAMNRGSLNYGEWCADHDHPLEANPAGQVGVGGPATLPDPLVATNGLWFNGTPYLGPDAVNRSRGPTPLPPGGALQNGPLESGISFMWHSHNEREITTNDVFPGGMLMMMLVDPPVWYIDETL